VCVGWCWCYLVFVPCTNVILLYVAYFLARLQVISCRVGSPPFIILSKASAFSVPSQWCVMDTQSGYCSVENSLQTTCTHPTPAPSKAPTVPPSQPMAPPPSPPPVACSNLRLILTGANALSPSEEGWGCAGLFGRKLVAGTEQVVYSGRLRGPCGDHGVKHMEVDIGFDDTLRQWAMMPAAPPREAQPSPNPRAHRTVVILSKKPSWDVPGPWYVNNQVGGASDRTDPTSFQGALQNLQTVCDRPPTPHPTSVATGVPTAYPSSQPTTSPTTYPTEVPPTPAPQCDTVQLGFKSNLLPAQSNDSRSGAVSRHRHWHRSEYLELDYTVEENAVPPALRQCLGIFVLEQDLDPRVKDSLSWQSEESTRGTVYRRVKGLTPTPTPITAAVAVPPLPPRHRSDTYGCEHSEVYLVYDGERRVWGITTRKLLIGVTKIQLAGAASGSTSGASTFSTTGANTKQVQILSLC
jgi:hypothetical protein